LLDPERFTREGRYHVAQTSVTLHLWSKNYLVMLCGQTNDTPARPVVNRLLFLCRPVQSGVPMSYLVRGDSLVRPGSRVKFK
jgi:hypothetical protein